MRVGAREGFAYHSLKLVLLGTGNSYEVDSITLILSNNAFSPSTMMPFPNSGPLV